MKMARVLVPLASALVGSIAGSVLTFEALQPAPGDQAGLIPSHRSGKSQHRRLQGQVDCSA
jgi:hypothetical protein